MKKTIGFNLNGKAVSLEVDPSRTLLWVLRDDLGLTGTKYGCGEGFCGACTVLVGRKAVRSCALEMNDVAGKEVMTIEGLAKDGELHPLQKAFVHEDALQCGYCTPGMIMATKVLLDSNPNPDIEAIKKALARNLCRCTGYRKIIDAVKLAGRF